MRVLAGDIGGTKTLLALAEVQGSRVRIIKEREFRSAGYSDFVSPAREFLESVGSELRSPKSSTRRLSRSRREASLGACFGVAGPVVAGRAKVTKLPWILDQRDLQRELGLRQARLINDFAAVAQGIEALDSEDLAELKPGNPDSAGSIAVLGAGTGLGEALLVRMGEHRIVIPGEGGHADFAPRNEREVDFLRWMTAKYGRVSYDRVLSGPGLADMYSFLRDSGVAAEAPELRKAIAEGGDPAPIITRFAGERQDPLSVDTLDLFTSIYGAEAGNLALRGLASGGVYLAGGIAPRILKWLREGRFRQSFVHKGRLSSFVEAIPVFVILNPRVGLLGAALAAARGK